MPGEAGKSWEKPILVRRHTLQGGKHLRHLFFLGSLSKNEATIPEAPCALTTKLQVQCEAMPSPSCSSRQVVLCQLDRETTSKMERANWEHM